MIYPIASLTSCGFFCSSVIGSISGWLSLLSAKAAGADIRDAEIRCWAGTCKGKKDGIVNFSTRTAQSVGGVIQLYV